MRCGLVFSGGAMKAFAFHLGVLRVLMSEGYVRRRVAPLADEERAGRTPIDVYVGSSAGASFATAAVFMESLDDIEAMIGLRPSRGHRFRYWDFLRPNPDLFKWGRKVAGFCYGSGIEQFVRRVSQPNDFKQLDAQLFVCATQLNSTRKVVFGPRDSALNGKYSPYLAYFNDVTISDAVAASSSYPFLYQPYRIKNPRSGNEIEYTDGEVRESLSVHVARDAGCDLAFISNIWVPYQFQANVGSITQRGFSGIYEQVVSLMVEQKIDKFRYDLERYKETTEAIRTFCLYKGISVEDTQDLIEQVWLTLGHRPMEEVYIAPRPDDQRFAFCPSFTLDPVKLAYCRDTGVRCAEDALSRHRKRVAQAEPTPLIGGV